MIFSTKPTRTEILPGAVYLIFELFILPTLLSLVNVALDLKLSFARINFLYFLINFAVVLPMFRRYLLRSVKDAWKMRFATIRYALLGFLGYQVLSELLAGLIFRICPLFVNFNDASILYALDQDFVLIAVGSILLVPVTEETLFRGMIFRGLYDRSPLAAYLVSMAAFAAIHVMGYIGSAEPVMILLAFLQYLPAGYCLCFAYRHSGSILSPILMHMIVNAVAVISTR